MAGRTSLRNSLVPYLRLRELLDALPTAVYTTDANGKVTFFNQACIDLAGRTPTIGTDEWCVTWRLYWPDGTALAHDACAMAVALKEQRPIHGAEAVAERNNDAQAKVLITADGGYRRGNIVQLKQNADESLDGSPSIEKMVVVRRTGHAEERRYYSHHDSRGRRWTLCGETDH